MKNLLAKTIALPLRAFPVRLFPEQSATGTPVVVRNIKWEILARHRSRPHFERKFYHFLMGMICFSLYAFVVEKTQALLLLGTIGGTFVGLDILRLKFKALNEFILRSFGKVMRREELKSVSGNSFFVLGLFVIVALFPKPIVLLSVLYLAIGDPIAAVIGSLYGKHKIIGKKSFEGALANWSFSSLATLVVALYYFGMGWEKALFMTVIGGVTSTLSELCPAPIDDNFTIPVASATLLSLINLFLPLF